MIYSLYFILGPLFTFDTNRSPSGRGKDAAKDIQGKIENVMRRLGVEMQVFVSTGRGRYRKPNTGMWEVLCQEVRDRGVRGV